MITQVGNIEIEVYESTQEILVDTRLEPVKESWYKTEQWQTINYYQKTPIYVINVKHNHKILWSLTYTDREHWYVVYKQLIQTALAAFSHRKSVRLAVISLGNTFEKMLTSA